MIVDKARRSLPTPCSASNGGAATIARRASDGRSATCLRPHLTAGEVACSRLLNALLHEALEPLSGVLDAAA